MRAERLAVGMTQRELAEAIGTTQAAVSKVETGRSTYTVAMAERVADAVSRVRRRVVTRFVAADGVEVVLFDDGRVVLGTGRVVQIDVPLEREALRAWLGMARAAEALFAGRSASSIVSALRSLWSSRQ